MNDENRKDGQASKKILWIPLAVAGIGVFLFVALACAGMLAFALYVQHVDFIDPCPLCVFQRMAYIAVMLIALVAAIHNPESWLRFL